MLGHLFKVSSTLVCFDPLYNMEGLRKQIAPIKGGITKIHIWLNTNKTQNDVYQFQVKVNLLEGFYKKYEDLLELIEDVGDDTIKNECNAMEDKYCSILSQLKRRIDELTGQTPVSSITGQVAPSTKLPEISINPFSGNFTEWNTFFELFESLILNNPTLTDIQKFIYLKSYLKGEPLELINSLSLTSSNLKTAIDTLTNRYANEFRIIFCHIKKLIEAPSLTKVSAPEIRKFITQARQGIQSLRNLNVPKEEWADLMLIFIYLQKLDFNTNRAFETERDHTKRPTLQEFFEFLDKRCSIMETVAANSPKNQTSSVKIGTTSSHFANTSSSHKPLQRSDNKSPSKNIKCLYCNNPHRMPQCDKYKRLSVQERFSFVRDKKLCRNCLSSFHHFDSCPSERTCMMCNKRHHTLLHIHNFQPPSGNNHNNETRTQSSFQRHPNRGNDSSSPPPTRPSGQSPAQSTNSSQHSRAHIQSSETVSCAAINKSNSEILLATAIVTLYTNEGEGVAARALLDNGSQASFISKDLVKRLNYQPYDKNMQVTGISQRITHSHKMIDLNIYSTINNKKEFSISFVVLDKLTFNIPRINVNPEILNIPKELSLADPTFFQSNSIDLLLGMDVYSEILCTGFRKLGKGLPVLINTYFGWTISGTLPVEKRTSPRTFHSTINTVENVDPEEISLEPENVDITHVFHSQLSVEDEAAEEVLQKFWTIEEVHSEKTVRTADEERAVQLFEDSTIRLKDGTFQVDLPLKSPNEYLKLGESFPRAYKRFIALEHKFKNHNQMYSKYKKFIDEYISLDHAKKIPLSFRNEKSELKYFLPHHSIVREDSATTKLRVVFDASMKSDTGYSLNDVMLKGPTVQPELFDILCRFRLSDKVFIADIEKMFRQIKVNPNQTFLQNILWREKPTNKLECLELQTVTYGTNSAPFLSTNCLIQLATSNSEKYPLASDALINQCYVDDILYSSETLQELLETHKQLTELLGTANMKLHKWSSNSSQFLEAISSTNNQETYVIASEGNTSKVLGISWQPDRDTFSVTLPKIELQHTATKRQVLSVIAQIFDPIGLINPFIVTAKVFMQKIWLEKMSWDEQLSPTLLEEWRTFCRTIPDLGNIKIPRNLFTPCERKSIIEIHAFSDASLKCYGTCIYVRAIYEDNSVSCNLLTSKSRVAPLKQITLPRLELCGAVLMAKLTKKIVSIFEKKININSVHLWTDSEIVLCWIKSHPSRWSLFVANRVAEIQTLVPNFDSWHHIKSSENPADILSRGCTPQELDQSKLWWNGPNFLHYSNAKFKVFRHLGDTGNIPEEKKTVLLIQNDENDFYKEVLNRYSSFRKLQRVIAYCLRYWRNSKKKLFNEVKIIGPLSPNELHNAEKVIIKIVQEKFFASEIKELKKSEGLKVSKALKALNPTLDEQGMLRVGGRIPNADIAYEHKHPLLLPSKNNVVRLLIKREHLTMLHAGPQNVLASIRQRYWPIDGLREVKGVIKQCLTCFKFRARPATQKMADLPKERLSVSRPFLNVGIDFGGPFLVKPSKLRHKTILKCYLCVFICMTTKAVHLEAVSSLSTEDFLQALRRFIGRRGVPSIIFSDHGTNFVGARNKLKEIYEFFKKNKNQYTIQDYLTTSEITWKFIPARSPHWGGIWEAAVKGAKHHLLRVVGESVLTYEEFSTVLIEIEAIMNSRPLCPLSNDPTDFSPLTPGHFLIGTALNSIPEADVSATAENKLKRWQRCQKIRQSFWKRWTVEYLSSLQRRVKWTDSYENLKVGDLVLLMDELSSPLKWPLARISEVLPGADKKVRAVKVITKDGVFTRSITKLCPLPQSD